MPNHWRPTHSLEDPEPLREIPAVGMDRDYVAAPKHASNIRRKGREDAAFNLRKHQLPVCSPMVQTLLLRCAALLHEAQLSADCELTPLHICQTSN